MDFALDGVDTKALSDEGVWFTVKKLGSTDPLLDKDGNPVQLKLLGPDSDVFVGFQRAQIKKRLNAPQDADPEEQIDAIEKETVRLLSMLTVDWKGVLTPDGAVIECSRETTARLYERYPVIREQVDAFVSSRANFLKGSSAN